MGPKHRPVTSPPFQYSCSPQHSSRLLQLPTELLLRILRLLHKHERPIKPLLSPQIHHSLKPPKVKLQLDLSSQVLASCQSLYQIAGEILYRGNTLEFIFRQPRNWFEPFFCYVADARIEIVKPAFDPLGSRRGLPLIQDLQTRWRNTLDPERLSSFQDYFTSLSKVENIHLTVEFPSNEDFYIVCRTTRGFLLNKNVTIQPCSIPSVFPNQLSRKQWEETCTAPCRILRCRSIKFVGFETDLSALEKVMSSRGKVLPLQSRKAFLRGHCRTGGPETGLEAAA